MEELLANLDGEPPEAVRKVENWRSRLKKFNEFMAEASDRCDYASGYERARQVKKILGPLLPLMPLHLYGVYVGQAALFRGIHVAVSSFHGADVLCYKRGATQRLRVDPKQLQYDEDDFPVVGPFEREPREYEALELHERGVLFLPCGQQYYLRANGVADLKLLLPPPPLHMGLNFRSFIHDLEGSLTDNEEKEVLLWKKSHLGWYTPFPTELSQITANPTSARGSILFLPPNRSVTLFLSERCDEKTSKVLTTSKMWQGVLDKAAEGDSVETLIVDGVSEALVNRALKIDYKKVIVLADLLSFDLKVARTVSQLFRITGFPTVGGETLYHLMSEVVVIERGETALIKPVFQAFPAVQGKTINALNGIAEDRREELEKKIREGDRLTKADKEKVPTFYGKIFEENCVICQGEKQDYAILPCGHRFHWDCVCKWVLEKRACPTCRSKCTILKLMKPPSEVTNDKIRWVQSVSREDCVVVTDNKALADSMPRNATLTLSAAGAMRKPNSLRHIIFLEGHPYAELEAAKVNLARRSTAETVVVTYAYFKQTIEETNVLGTF